MVQDKLRRVETYSEWEYIHYKLQFHNLVLNASEVVIGYYQYVGQVTQNMVYLC